jgi:hypothetical protein
MWQPEVMTMRMLLPYAIDTTGAARTVLAGAAGLLAVLGAGVLVSVLLRQAWADAFGFLAIAGLVLFLAHRIWRHLPGLTGVITPQEVRIEPGIFLGLPMAGPRGTFPVARFAAVRFDRSMNLTTLQWAGRVVLVGRPGGPDITICTSPLAEARTLAADLAEALALPMTQGDPA